MDKALILKMILKGSLDYSTLVGRYFCFKSGAFKYRDAYTIYFDEANFLHLTGVKTTLSAKDFYLKCIGQTLTINDFEIESVKDPNLKMHIEMKMKNIQKFSWVVKKPVDIEERYSRGKIKCVIATSHKKFTVCFIDGSYKDKNVLVPMSLLYGRLLHPQNNLIRGVVAIETSSASF